MVISIKLWLLFGLSIASIAAILDRARVFFLRRDDINKRHLIYRYGVLGEVAAIPTARKMILE